MMEPARTSVLSDLTRLPFRTAAFDFIVCYHVLEHIPDDTAAMRELSRVLTAGGIALVQVPHKPDAIPTRTPGRTRMSANDGLVRAITSASTGGTWSSGCSRTA